jgi:hypothetical protein
VAGNLDRFPFPTEQDMSNQPANISLACVLDAIPSEERPAHVALIERLIHRAAEDRQELEHGFAFRFPAAEFDAVATFVSHERLCCPFLDFEIALTAAGTLWLRLTGPTGTREFRNEELAL